jgi:D-psicose/D-tagatose/L-ribulose 3-epimerase
LKVAMHNWMRAEPVETTIQRLARYGYDGIEISYDSVELAPGAPGTKAVAGMLRDNGIECAGAISLMFQGRDLIHADPQVRADSVDYLRKSITMVKELGGDLMSIVPSEVGKVKAMASPEEEWAWAIEGLKELRDHANASGVQIGIEPLNRFETNFVNRSDQAPTPSVPTSASASTCTT